MEELNSMVQQLEAVLRARIREKCDEYNIQILEDFPYDDYDAYGLAFDIRRTIEYGDLRNCTIFPFQYDGSAAYSKLFPEMMSSGDRLFLTLYIQPRKKTTTDREENKD
jgi:hypothetical protein